MNAGMLWFDNDPKTALAAKIERAVDYYKHKYGRDPNLCLLHPSMLPPDAMTEKDKPATGKPVLPQGHQDGVSKVEGIVVRPYRPVLPGHLWIGIEDKN